MSDKRKKSGETVTQYTPNPAISPHLRNIVGQAQSIYNQQRNTPYFPGSVVPEFSPQSQGAFGMIGGLAADPSQLNAALGQNQATLEGRYLDPTVDPRFQRGLDRINNMVGSAVGGARRVGSGAHAQGLGEAGGAFMAGIYGDERGRQMQAGLLAPALDQARYTGPGQLRGVGQALEGQDAARRAEEFQRYGWDVAGGRESAALANYQNAVNASPLNQAGTNTSTQYAWTNPAMQYAGLGIQGASLLAAPFTGGASLAGLGLGGSMGGGGNAASGGIGPSSVFGPGGWEAFYGLGGR